MLVLYRGSEPSLRLACWGETPFLPATSPARGHGRRHATPAPVPIAPRETSLPPHSPLTPCPPPTVPSLTLSIHFFLPGNAHGQDTRPVNKQTKNPHAPRAALTRPPRWSQRTSVLCPTRAEPLPTAQWLRVAPWEGGSQGRGGRAAVRLQGAACGRASVGGHRPRSVPPSPSRGGDAAPAPTGLPADGPVFLPHTPFLS